MGEEEELASAVLDTEKGTIQERLGLFCREYNSCVGFNGYMDTARESVLKITEQLTSGAKSDSILAASEIAERKMENVRAQLNKLNADVVRIVEEIKARVQDFVPILVEYGSQEKEKEDKQRISDLLQSKRSVSASTQSKVLDLLNAEERRYLDAFIKSSVSDPAHKILLEDLTTQITVRVCKSIMTGVKVPAELITDPTTCFERHLKSWQSAFDQIHAQHERLEKVIHTQQEEAEKKTQLDAGIVSAETVLKKLTSLKNKVDDLCSRLQDEIKDPGCFYRTMRFLHLYGPSAEEKKGLALREKLGTEHDDIAIRKRGLELQREAATQIEELIEKVNLVLAEAKLAQEHPANLAHALEGLGAIKGLLSGAQESIDKAKKELREYEDKVVNKKDERAASFGWRWQGMLVAAAVTATLTTGMALLQKEAEAKMGFA